ncbi:MAG TPA: hypothetical protein PLH94_11455 [Fimbriimonadaceae bacterium]|nr:hypothetical protein [Fimbriimonadaceae bacterium]
MSSLAERLRPLLPYLLIVFVPLVILARPIFAGEWIGAVDDIRTMAPWDATPGEPWDVLQADSILQFQSWRDLVFRAWSNGEAPFWNPYTLGGTPLLANSQSGALYPPHAVVGVLGIPTALAIALLAWLHLAIVGLGVAALGRRLGGSVLGTTLAGMGVVGSAFFLGWTALPSVLSTCAWIPWILFFILGTFHESGPRRVVRGIGIALSTWLLLSAGHLQFAAYGLMAAGLLLLWLVGAHRRILPAVVVVAGLALGGLLAAPQILPVLEYSKFSHRANTPSEAGYEAYQASALKPFQYPGLLVPTVYGNPTVSVEGAAGPSAFWPAYVKRGENFAESAFGLGPLLLLLLAAVPWRRVRWRDAGGLGAIALFGLLLAIGSPLGRILYFAFPGWSSTGSPARAGVLFLLGAAALAALAFQESERDEEPSPRGVGLAFLGLIAVAIVGTRLAASGLPSWIEGLDPGTWAVIRDRGLANGLTTTVLCVAVVTVGYAVHVFLRGKPAARFALPASCIIVAIMFGLTILRTGAPLERPTLADAIGKHERVGFVNQTWGLLDRARALMPPNTPTLFRIHDLAGYDSLLHRDTVRLLNGIVGGDPAPPANGNMMLLKAGFEVEPLSDAGVTTLFSQTRIPGLGEPTPIGNVLRYTVPGPGRASTPQGAAAIVEETLSHITVRAKGPGTLTLRDRNMPGWSASIEGRDVPIRGATWREVDLPPGEHRVVFRYLPPGYTRGVTLHRVALAILLLALVFVLVKGRPTPVDNTRSDPPPSTS